MRLLLPLVALALVLSACGARSPDWDTLSRLSVPDVCGQDYTGEELVRLAYDSDAMARLPMAAELPEGTIGGGVVYEVADRTYPCANDPEEAKAALEAGDYTGVSHVSTADTYMVMRGVDPYGIDGTYLVFRCDFVSDVVRRTFQTSFFTNGLFGTLAHHDGTAAPLRAFMSLAFQVGLPTITDVGFVPLYEQPVLLDIRDTFEVDPWCDEEPCPENALRLCAVWVEPNFYGGCDLVRVGASVATVQEDGTFWQPPMVRDPRYELVGWCNRSPI